MQNGLSALRSKTLPRQIGEWRQLSAIDKNGRTGVFSGNQNGSVDEVSEDGLILTGNILSNKTVLTQMRDTFLKSNSSIGDRLIAALRAGAEAAEQQRLMS